MGRKYIVLVFDASLQKSGLKKKVQKGEGECISVSSLSAFLCYGAAVTALVKTVKSRVTKGNKI